MLSQAAFGSNYFATKSVDVNFSRKGDINEMNNFKKEYLRKPFISNVICVFDRKITKPFSIP